MGIFSSDMSHYRIFVSIKLCNNSIPKTTLQLVKANDFVIVMFPTIVDSDTNDYKLPTDLFNCLIESARIPKSKDVYFLLLAVVILYIPKILFVYLL